MRTKQLKYIFSVTLIAFSHFCFPQTTKSALGMLNIAPDARSSAMGDLGTATSPDAFSQHWNASKYVFSESKGGVGLAYVPWLRKAIKDSEIIYLSGFYKADKTQSISASLRYFKLGNIQLYSENTDYIRTISPNDFAVDAAYSRILGKTVSGAVTFRYINSSKIIMQNTVPIVERTSNVAADISFYFREKINTGFANKPELAFGVCLSNVGTKIRVSDSIKYFLPMAIRLGSEIKFDVDNYNFIGFNLELGKLLANTEIKYRNKSVISAMGKELTSNFSKIIYAFGAEYSHKNLFFVRCGYHYENKDLGNNSYLTLGSEIVYKNWSFGASYLFVTRGENSLIDNTYRFSVGYFFGLSKRGSYYDYDL